MSHSVSFADYRAALTTPGLRGPVIAAAFARLPIAMIGIALLFYVQRETGSFATAGLVSGGALVGAALGSVGQGRIMDRMGPSRPLLVTTSAFTLTICATILAVEAGAATPILLMLACTIGVTQPTVASASRALWSRALPAGRARQAGYNYDAISIEVFFILGPGISGLLLGVPWPGTGVVVGAVVMTVGAIGFALTPTVRALHPLPADRSGGSMLGALASPGLRTVALAAMGLGTVIGFIEVAVPAAATLAGNQPMGGVLLSLMSLGSVAFGLLYGMRPWPHQIHHRLPVLLLGFGALVALLAVPSGLVGLAFALVLAGTMITPQGTAHSTALEQVAPQGTMAEAFGWVITAVTLGLALGQSAGGWLVENVSIPVTFLVAAAAGLGFGVLVWSRRETMAAPIPAHSPAPTES